MSIPHSYSNIFKCNSLCFTGMSVVVLFLFFFRQAQIYTILDTFESININKIYKVKTNTHVGMINLGWSTNQLFLLCVLLRNKTKKLQQIVVLKTFFVNFQKILCIFSHEYHSNRKKTVCLEARKESLIR